MWAFSRVIRPLKIFVEANVGHGCERLGKTPGPGFEQQGLEQDAMFSLGAPAVAGGTQLQRIHHALIQVSDDKVCH